MNAGFAPLYHGYGSHWHCAKASICANLRPQVCAS
jgi:hypothetical protein